MGSCILIIIKIDNTWAICLFGIYVRISAKDILYFNVQIITPILKINIAYWYIFKQSFYRIVPKSGIPLNELFFFPRRRLLLFGHNTNFHVGLLIETISATIYLPVMY